MTRNQISYHELQETKRSNLARELETHRSNLAIEQETRRHNISVESETAYSNRRNEALKQQSNILSYAASKYASDAHVTAANISARATINAASINASTQRSIATETTRRNIITSNISAIASRYNADSHYRGVQYSSNIGAVNNARKLENDVLLQSMRNEAEVTSSVIGGITRLGSSLGNLLRKGR